MVVQDTSRQQEYNDFPESFYDGMNVMNNDNEKLIAALIGGLPDFTDIPSSPDHFWSLMEVNNKRIRQQMVTPDYVKERLPVLGSVGIHLLAKWIGIDLTQTKKPNEAIEVVAEQFAARANQIPYQTILFLSEFVYRRQTGPIETLSQLLLTADTFALISDSDIDEWSRRFCYVLIVYLQKYDNLRLLLLFENGERVGYVRCTLTPIAERSGQPLNDEEVHRVETKIKNGVNLGNITRERVDSVLEEFESLPDGRRSRCFGVIDEADGTKLVFILRAWREAIVRQVEDVVFADEAELIVLRLKDKGVRLEEHGSSTNSRRIAAAILGDLLGEKAVQYLKTTQTTARNKVDDLLNKQLMADIDDQLRLQELYLLNSAVDQTPLVILRCDKQDTLTRPILDLRERGIDLLANLDDIRHIKIVYVINKGTRYEKAYSFKIFFKVDKKTGDFFLPYSVANVPTQVRASFEEHLWREYEVRVIPGTG
jgi:hypothetical protein